MATEEVIWLLLTGAALGAAARYLLALDVKLHTAIYGGVLVLVVGPWVFRRLGIYLADWSIFDLVGGAVAVLLLATAARAIVAYVRRQHLRRQRARGAAS